MRHGATMDMEDTSCLGPRVVWYACQNEGCCLLSTWPAQYPAWTLSVDLYFAFLGLARCQ